MNNKLQSLKSELVSLGIDADNLTEGTVNGSPAIFIYKDGDEEHFTGYSDADVASGFAAEAAASLMRRFGK